MVSGDGCSSQKCTPIQLLPTCNQLSRVEAVEVATVAFKGQRAREFVITLHNYHIDIHT